MVEKLHDVGGFSNTHSSFSRIIQLDLFDNQKQDLIEIPKLRRLPSHLQALNK